MLRLVTSATGMSTLQVVGVAAVGAVTAAWWMTRTTTKKGADTVVDDSGPNEAKLHAVECSMVMMDEPAITTITFVKGDPAAAAAYLKQRVADIVRANPWLGGKLTRPKGKKGVYLRWDPSSAPSLFVEHGIDDPSLPPMTRDTPYAKLVKACEARGMVMGNGDESLAKHAHMFKVSLIPDAEHPTERFGVVMSLTHAIGDGYTFYQMHNMLSMGRPLTALDARRVHQAHAEAEKATQEVGGLTNISPWLILKMMYAYMRVWCGWDVPECCAHYVDQQHVAQRKEEAKREGSVSFVSTNDVITSQFLSAPHVHRSVMVVNFRNKIACVCDAHAGNYMNIISYAPPDVASPSLIRKSLITLKRAAVPPTKLVEGPRRLGEIIAMVTNWASFDQGLELSHCTQDLHLPLYDPATIPIAVIQMVVIFRASEGGLAFLLFGDKGFVRHCEARGVCGKPVELNW